MPVREAIHELAAIGLVERRAHRSAIVAAILRGDRDAAAAEMRAHIATVEIAYARFAENA